LSHWPIVSTAGRVAYVGMIPILFPCLLLEAIVPGAWDIRRELIWWLDTGMQYKAVFYGLAAADFVHFGLDVLTTEHKNKERK